MDSPTEHPAAPTPAAVPHHHAPAPLVIHDDDLATVGFLTHSGICFLCRAWFNVICFVALALIGLSIWDRILCGPTNQLHGLPDFIIAGTLGKLNDVSFWISAIGLFAGGLILSACVRVFNADTGTSFAVRIDRRELARWTLLTLLAWAVYICAIFLPAQGQSALLSSLPPEKRWPLLIDGLLNLWLIVAIYFFAFLAGKIAPFIQKKISQLGAERPTTPAAQKAADNWLMAGAFLRNLPFLILPVIFMAYATLIVLCFLADKVLRPALSPTFDFNQYGFHPLSGLTDQWKLVAFYFVLLMIPLSLPSFKVHRPRWAVRRILGSRTTGGLLMDKVLLKTKKGHQHFRLLNLVLFYWRC